MDITFQSISQGLGHFMHKHTKILIYSVILIVTALFLYFFYTNVYITTVNPKEIDTNTIASKKQKVNLELFNQVIEDIQDKQDVSLSGSQVPDPLH